MIDDEVPFNPVSLFPDARFRSPRNMVIHCFEAIGIACPDHFADRFLEVLTENHHQIIPSRVVDILKGL